MSNGSPRRAPPGLNAPPGLSSRAGATRSGGGAEGSTGRGATDGFWQAGSGYPNDAVTVRDGEVMLEGVSPAEEEQAANVGASPALGGRSGLTDLMEAIEDIDGPAEPSDDEDETAPAADAGDEITDDFLNPTNCFICTEPIQFHALGSCNHRVCHVCSLRLRALYKVKSCAYCKRDLDRVVFTRSSDRPYKSFSKRDLPFEDRKLAIRFEDREMFEDTMVLLRFNCPEPTCDVACPGGWKELKRHVKEGHNLLLCDICTRHKKIFTHEHQIYTSSTLQQHYRGTNTSEPAFKGHPECGFCHTRFYGDDELWEHCRDKHEECFICVRRGIRHRYYMDYSRLADHFETEHYACKHPSCLERKFVVFENEIELKAHDVETHGASAGGSKKAFRKVELELPPRRQTPTLEREQRRPSPAPSSAQQQPLQTAFPPLSAPAPTPAAASAAAEPKASQRRLKPPPGFGSQLTQTAPAAGAASSSSAAGSAEIPAALQDIFGNDARKYTEFRSLAQAYKGSIITADEFVRSMVGLATEGLTDDRVIREKEADIGRVWTRMAETAPAGTGTRSGLPRKEDMLRAWKEYKLSRSQFPDLPTPASSRPGASSSESINRGTYSATANPRITTVNNSKADRARVLVIKSNARKHTATVPSQPKRSVYDQIAEEALRRNSSRDERFEQDREERELLQRAATEGATLPESRVQVLSRNEFEERKAILEGRPGPSSSSSEHSAAPRWTKASSSAHEFPSLPAATKPVRLGRGSASSSAWSAQADQPVDEPPSESGDGRKKNKKKQVLMKIGL